MKTVSAVFSTLGLVAASLLFVSIPAFAQGGDVGSIVGSVTDKGGGALSGATVTVIDTQRGVTRTLTTDDAGQYSAPNLTPGTYTVKGEYMGFQALEQQNILVQVGTQIRIDLSLQPGSQSQTITVTEEAPLVETTNAVLGGALNNQLISDLPLNGRNFNRLLDLQPGLYVQPGSGKWSQSSNGMRAEHNVYILNGIDTVEGFSSQSVLNSSPVFGDATSILPVDAIQEFNTEQNPSAEYGWKPGAIVNVGLKSGTNTIHGTANAFGRDSALDATNSFINPAIGQAKQQTAIETYGATVGGPIVKDKLFFFLGYEGQNNHISAPSASDSLPTVAALTGSTATTNSLLTACNALSTAPNVLSLKLAGLTYGGSPETCNVTSPYTGIFQTAAVANGSDPVTPIGNDKVNNGLAKVDYHLNEKNTFSGEFFMGNFDGLGFQGAPAQPYWDVAAHAKSMIVGAHWTYLASSSIVNEAHFGVNRFFQPSYPGDCGSVGQPSGEEGIDWGTPESIIPQTGEPANCGMPPITIQGFTPTGCCSSFPKIQGPDYTVQGIDSLSYIRGNHSFKFGGEARHMSTREGTFSQSRGSLSFANGVTGGATGLQQFLLGNISTSTLPSELVGTPDVHVTDKGYSLFAQDDWRLKRNFTANLGVRFERVTPIQEQNNQLANFDPNTPTGLIQLGQTKNLYPVWNNFSPRIGFAWDILGNSKWVLRGGFNIMYVLEGFNVFISQQNTSPVTTGLNTTPTGAFFNNGTSTVAGSGNMETAILTFQSINWLNASTPVFPSVAPTQLACNSPTNAAPNNNTCPILAVNPNLRRPYAPAWNLSIQHPINNDLSLQVAYVGSHGVGLLGLDDANAPAPGSGWETYNAATKTCSPGSAPAKSISTTCENISRPYFSEFPYFSNINQIQNLDFSNYNALQVTLTQRPWHGLNYVLGYVYSHCFEMGSGDWNGDTLPSDVDNPRADYGNCLTDVRHSLTWSVSYVLPGKKGFGQMLEGWKLNSIVKYQTALPWNVADTKDNISATGELEDRWDFFGNPSDFAGLGAAGVPFYLAGTPPVTDPLGPTDPAYAINHAPCVNEATSLNGSLTPVFSGWTTANSGYLASLTKFGCFANGSSVMLPPAFGTFGNEQRNGFRGEAFRQWDLSVSKLVRFTERLSGEFRFEAFNVLNQTDFFTNLGNPSVSGSFGSSRQTPDVGIANATVGSGGPRSIQLGLRLQF